MKLELKHNRIVITPESAEDAAFIEGALGLKAEGDYVQLVRREEQGSSLSQRAGLSPVVFLETRRPVVPLE